MTNYEKLFGTPERAAQTIARGCSWAGDCDGCAMCILPCKGNGLRNGARKRQLLGWLESEAKR